jgi:hypothetical protein
MTNTQPKTFMFLPDNMHRPDDIIHLGTILLLSEETRLPDPDTPLNKYTRLAPYPTDVREPLTEEPWSFSNGRVLTGAATLSAEIPFVPVGASLVLGRSRSDDIAIHCDKVVTTRFAPSPEYLRQATANQDIKEYCRGRLWPSVYMVTGIKVAYNTTVENKTAKSFSGKVGGSFDATGAGAPLKVELSPEYSHSEGQKLGSGVKDAYILAYQLKRLKMRKDATIRKPVPFNKHALFDDDPDVQAERTDLPMSFSDEWDEEVVTVNTAHDN